MPGAYAEVRRPGTRPGLQADSSPRAIRRRDACLELFGVVGKSVRRILEPSLPHMVRRTWRARSPRSLDAKIAAAPAISRSTASRAPYRKATQQDCRGASSGQDWVYVLRRDNAVSGHESETSVRESLTLRSGEA